MSVIKLEEPRVLDPSTGNYSYWVAAYNSIRFKYHRQDAAYVSVTDVDGFARFDISYINPAPGISPMTGDVIYASGESYGVNCIITAIEDIIVSGHPSIGLVTDWPYNGNSNGYVNDTTEKANWKLEVVIQKQDGGNYEEIAKANYRALTDGTIWLELQEYLKPYFNNNYNYIPTGFNYVDEGNSIGFSLKYREYFTGYEEAEFTQENNYYALNAALQLGDKYGPNMNQYVMFDYANETRFLTSFKEPTYWKGMPFSLSFIYQEDAGAYTLVERWYDINRLQVDIVAHGEVENNIAKLNQLGTQRGLISNYPFSYSSLRLHSSYYPYEGVSEEKMIRVKTPCDITNSSYLVWKNQLGGWDYYLFENRNSENLVTSNGDTFQPWVENLSTATSLEKTLNKTAFETITLSAGNIDLNDLTGIKSILKSIAVYILNPEAAYNTIQVSVEPGSWLVNDTKANYFDIEFTIKKPNQIIQHL